MSKKKRRKQMKKELKRLMEELSPLSRLKFLCYLQQGKDPRLHAAILRGLLRRERLKKIRECCKKQKNKPRAQHAADENGSARYQELQPYSTISSEYVNYLNSWEN
jgi:hypothetical protein